jgi:membrane protein DedA with SNARE-associated domain
VAAGRLGDALAPTLIAKHPLALIAMEARNRNLLLVSSKVGFVPFLVVGTVRRLLSDPLFYALGYLYGDRAVRWMEREVGDSSQRVERWFRRASYPLVFFAPGLPVCVLAGATEVPVPVFVVLNVTGTIVTVIVLRLAGNVFSGPIDAVNRFISANFRWLTLITIALTAWWLIDRRRRGRPTLTSVAETEAELIADRPDEPGDERPER